MGDINLISRRIWLTGAALAVILGIAFLLAWISSGYTGFADWESFVLAELLSVAVGVAAFNIFSRESIPGWMAWLVVGAAVLRLGLGIFWVVVLPVWGYPNEIQQAGYVMFDPFQRDGAAWDLAVSGEPLLSAFSGYSSHDQYGGLLFLSAWLYRFIGGETHIPLLVVVLTSGISALGVLFAWGFTRRLWGETAASVASWSLAVYPEAVLLGSSQMREAFTIPLGAAIAFLLLRHWQEKRWSDLLVIFLLAGITAAISWAYLVLLGVILILLLLGLVLERYAPLRLSAWHWIGIAGLGGAVLTAVRYLWRILLQMSDFQGHLTHSASGVLQAVYSRLPEILHTPFMVGYGVVRPLLPAALVEEGESILWRSSAIIRSIGWTILLAFLVLVTIQIVRKRLWLKPVGLLMWGNWLMVLVASYRAGGDMWDNPRYRAGFIIFQLALVGWVVWQQRLKPDPLMRRVAVLVLIELVWMITWYLPRYIDVPWNAGRIENRLIIGLVIGALYWIWDWQRTRTRREVDRAE